MLNLQIGRRYRHKSCLDIDIRILSKEEYPDHLELDVVYVAQRDPKMIFEYDFVKIKKADLGNWKEAT